VHRLHFRAVGLGDVHGVPVGARLGQDALQHLLGTRAPHAHLDAVFLLEGGGDGPDIVGLRRGVEIELAFLLRALDQPWQAVRPVVEADVGGGGVWLELAERGGREEDSGEGGDGEESELGVHEGIPGVVGGGVFLRWVQPALKAMHFSACSFT